MAQEVVMAQKKEMGKVKLRVRENALTMKEFTVEEMVKATGFNEDSVVSELRRMRQGGLITAHNVKTSQRGRPRRIFRLTSDPEKRLMLSSQVAEFYPKPPAQARPTSHHYFNAVSLLDSFEAGDCDEEERGKLLSECEEELSFAWHEEGSPEGVLDAFIQSQKGRVEYLRGNYEQAESLLEKSMETFAAFGLPEEKAWAGEYLLASLVQRKLKEEPSSSLLDKARSMIEKLRSLGASLSVQNPVSVLLLGMSEQLASALEHPSRTMVLADANDTVERAAVNALWKAVDMAHGGVAFWGGKGLPGRLGAASQPHYADVSSVSPVWKHNMPDRYSYEQHGGNELVTAINSPPRKHLSAAIAAAAGPMSSEPQGWWVQAKD